MEKDFIALVMSVWPDDSEFCAREFYATRDDWLDVEARRSYFGLLLHSFSVPKCTVRKSSNAQ